MDRARSQRTAKSPSILIVGAGAAGLSAARRLKQNGFTNIIILEASDRIGGRVQTVSFGKSSQNIVELGANWIHGGSVENPVFTTATQKGLLSDITYLERRSGLFYLSNGEVVDKDLGFKAFDTFMKIENEAVNQSKGKQLMSDISMEEFLNHNIQGELEKCKDTNERNQMEGVFNCLRNFLTFHIGDSLEKLSVKQYAQYVEMPGGDVKLPTGYTSILKCICDDLPRDAIHFEMKVTRINWNDTNQKVTVQCENGRVWNADNVIITIPLGYLKQLHGSLFNPELPVRKRRAIENLGFGRVNKIFLYYEEPFWQKGMGSIRLAWQDESVQGTYFHPWVRYIFAFDEVLNNPNVLVAWIAGNGAESMENLSETQIAVDCTDVLRRFTNNPSIPEPKRVLRSQWCKNPLIFGSYTYLPVHCPNDSLLHLAEPLPSVENPQVVFAGEATHPKYFSTVTGAVLSGLREADRLITLYRGKVSKL